MRILAYILLFVLSPHFKGIAQTSFKFEHITVNDGLSHSDAMAVEQDKDGFIWIGTNKGLDRYDGYSLKNYKLPNKNTTGQYTNRVLSLHLAQNGLLWVVPEAQGVFFFDAKTDSFKNIVEKTENQRDADLLSNLTARSINTAPNGDLFIGTSTQGLFVITFSKEETIRQIQKVNFSENGSDALVFAITPEKNGKVWVGTVGAGLWSLTKNNAEYSAKKFTLWSENTIRSIIISHSSDIWVASEDKVIKINKAANAIKPLEGKFNYMTSLLEDSYKRLWIGSRTGLYLLTDIVENPERITFRTEHFSPKDNDPSSLNYHLIHNMIEDGFNNLWIAASAGGLNKLNLLPKPFYHLHKRFGGLPNDYTNTICQDKDKNILWIGTRNGFSKFDISTQKVTTFLEGSNLRNTPNVDVTYIYDPGNGTLWITTRVHGVYIFNKVSETLRKLPEIAGQKPWNKAEPIAINSDSEGNIWVACFYDGLYIYDASGNLKHSFTKAKNQLPSARLTYLMRDGHSMWLSTRDAGILKLKLAKGKLNVEKQFSFHQKGLNTDYIWPLTKAKNGDIWVGTIGGGLHKINQNGTVERYNTYLPETDVESILEDESGDLWVGGNGLYRFDPLKKTYLHFDVADGLQSNSFKVGSAAKDNQGNLYFGGINGVTYFNPKQVSTNPHPPKMQITQVRFLNYEYSPDNRDNSKAVISGPFSPNTQITVRDYENDFSIEFVGLNFINPGKQHYEYKLEGFHKNWIALPQGQRVMGFSNLPAGTYTFLVKSDNGDGVWTEEPAKLKLKIMPPWYKTWWAYTVYTLLIAAAIYWYKTTTRRQRELKNKIAIEQVEKEKEKELADLKMNFFTNVSHELRTPLTLILNPAEDLIHAVEPASEARQKAVLVHKQASKLLDLVNQLMDFRKAESGTMTVQLQTADIIALITEIFLIFKIKADELGILYQLKVPKDPVFLNYDPEKLEIVLTNLLSNAFKHTPQGGSIVLDVGKVGNPKQDAIRENGKLANNFLRIQVKDSGKGIHSDDIQHIFEPFYQAVKNRDSKTVGTGIGLSLVHELVYKHNGEIDVESTPGKGAAFSLKLPFEKNNIPAIVHEESPKSTSASEDESFIPISDARLLIVEDNDDLRNYLVSLFNPHLETHSAENGAEGLEKTIKLSPDIILSDVMMPELNGLELSEKIKNNPKTAHIPIVLLTARATAIHELEGLESGADDYITKPFNPKVLLSKIHSLLNNRRKVQEYFHRKILVEPSESVIPDADREFIKNSMKIIEDNLVNEQFNVQTLVKESGMSQSAYYRKLKNITGQSVIEFIKDVRLKRAAQLLSSKQYRVSEVAMMVGMEDLKNFRTSFQKLYGVSPSEYGK